MTKTDKTYNDSKRVKKFQKHVRSKNTPLENRIKKWVEQKFTWCGKCKRILDYCECFK